MNRGAGWAISGGLLAAAMLAACSPAGATPQGVLRDSYDLTGAVFSFGTLKGELGAPVPSVAAAAEVELLRRGYAVERVDATQERARVEARRPGGRTFERVVITATRLEGGTTRVGISHEPMGDRDEQASLWEGLRARLGAVE